jgi:hypothetical protein
VHADVKHEIELFAFILKLGYAVVVATAVIASLNSRAADREKETTISLVLVSC